jgi:EAL domain-containing protein (putative c-di-GMP-specific phosphodiesterase class I)
MHVGMGVDLRKSKKADGGATDAQLLHAIDRDVRAGQPRAVLALHIAQLQAPAPRPYHRRIAKAMLDDAALNHAGQVFARGNADMVLICEPSAAARLRDTLTRLFRVDAPTAERLLSLWTLPQDATALESYLASTLSAATVTEEPSAAPGAIGAMDALIGTVRLTDLIRRQVAVQLVAGGMVPMYRELTFSMEALDARVNGGAMGTAQADPYLFRHLAGRLDAKMMDLLAHELARPGSLPPTPALHLNLTVRAILSPGFLRLTDAAEGAGATIGVEIALMDACADAQAFGAANMVLRAHGCVVVLDTIGHQALLLTRLEALDPDLVKLDWAPRMVGLGSRERRLLTEALQRIGPKRMVLHRVEARAALAWGMTQGITRFQGRHIDALLAAGRLEDCPQAANCTLRQCTERAGATGAAGRSGCLNTTRLDSAAMTAAVLP